MFLSFVELGIELSSFSNISQRDVEPEKKKKNFV